MKRHIPAISTIIVLVLTLLFVGCDQSEPGASEAGAAQEEHESLVVYCAHDSVYSEAVLRDFEQKTGIPISIRFDSEATKSLGLTEMIVREKNSPRCDVFWNNEIFGTIDLAERGLLQPYKGPGYERIAAQFKDADGLWTGFGARFRVYIINTDKMQPTPEAVESALAGDLSRMAVAKPLYGTTLTHYSVLWHAWGPEKLKAWHADWRARGVLEKGGNSTTKNLVAAGAADLGWTDTDDYFLAEDAGEPVAMLPVTVDEQVICIPNSVAIVRGTNNLTAAQKLVDFLLSEESELALARSAAQQVPLGRLSDDAQLPPRVRKLAELVSKGYPLAQVAQARQQCLAWLKAEYLE